MAKAERKSARDLRNLCTLPENSAECLGSRRSAAGVTIYLSMRIHSKSCHIFPLKVAATLLT